MMITIEQVKIYKKYQGDIDGWARSGSTKEKSLISDSAWSEIDLLIGDIGIYLKGLGSDNFNKDFQVRIEEKCISKEVQEMLFKLAEGY